MIVGGTMRNLLEQFASPDERQLVASTVASIDRAGMTALSDELRRRLFGPMLHIGRLFEDAGGLHPMFELLLLELRDVATAPGWTQSERIRRGLDAIALAGF
jgi:hypothetical protein